MEVHYAVILWDVLSAVQCSVVWWCNAASCMQMHCAVIPWDVLSVVQPTSVWELISMTTRSGTGWSIFSSCVRMPFRASSKSAHRTNCAMSSWEGSAAIFPFMSLWNIQLKTVKKLFNSSSSLQSRKSEDCSWSWVLCHCQCLWPIKKKKIINATSLLYNHTMGSKAHG